MMDRLRGPSVSTARRALPALLLPLVALLYAQAPSSPPFTVVSPDGRRTLPVTPVDGQELVALDDVNALFGTTLREDTLAGGAALGFRGRTVVMTAARATIAVNGRLVTLPSPIVRSGARWLAPLDLLPRAVGPLVDQRIDLRRAARLVVIGAARVPRVSVRIDAADARTRVTVDVSPAAEVEAHTEADRITLRVAADALDATLPQMAGGAVDQLRLDPQAPALIVHLAARAGTPRISTTTSDTDTRIVIDVATADGGAAGVTPPATAATAPLAGLETARRAGPQTLVIDPGHGGGDVGARGADGGDEKQVTLDVARRVKALIETRLGLRVLLTRDDDRDLSADARAAFANNNKADLLISLHANASPSPAIAGAEVFHAQLDREGEEARRLAESQAVALPVVGGGTRPLELVRWDLAQAPHVDASATLARLLEEELGTRVTMGTRPRRQAPLRVLLGANMPAALVEMGYLSNPAQAAALRGDTYQALVAQAIADAVVRLRTPSDGDTR